MCDDLADLKKRRISLRAALYSGAQSVRHSDKQVMNRSVDEIKKAIEALDEQIATLEGRRRSRVFYIDARRGY